MSKPIYISDDFPVEGLTGSTQPQRDAIVVGSPTGKYPAPLQDNVKSPAVLEANRIVHLKNSQYPKL
jgi:hypothetical protein